MMTATESLDYLYGLIPKGIKFGLNNISAVLSELGNPQLNAQSIHIAGTNGKGSTAAFCESILRNAGYRVGLYTSPHLVHFCERIQINRTLMAESEMIKIISRVKKAAEDIEIPITFFEFATAMAFLHFSEQKTDINVIEVGMGGRLDATSLCKGDISIITSISKDHTAYLGEELEKIAFEKASILKEGGTVFAIKGVEEVNQTIKDIANQKSAKLNFLGDHFWVEGTSNRTFSQYIKYINKKLCLENLELSLIGDFQAKNAALAISACLFYANKTGKGLSEESIRKGLKGTSWCGRMEIVSSEPTIILDAAHNPAAVKEMADSIKKLFSYSRAIVILGVMKDKPSGEILKILSTFADHFILVRPNQERSENPERLKQIMSRHKVPCEVIESVPNAIRKVKQILLSDDIVCITGSIFTVGEAKKYLKNDPDFKTSLSPSGDIHLNG
jgi:dihydrofolate synthase / folylpolyglutamate synthase